MNTPVIIILFNILKDSIYKFQLKENKKKKKYNERDGSFVMFLQWFSFFSVKAFLSISEALLLKF